MQVWKHLTQVDPYNSIFRQSILSKKQFRKQKSPSCVHILNITHKQGYGPIMAIRNVLRTPTQAEAQRADPRHVRKNGARSHIRTLNHPMPPLH